MNLGLHLFIWVCVGNEPKHLVSCDSNRKNDKDDEASFSCQSGHHRRNIIPISLNRIGDHEVQINFQNCTIILLWYENITT